VTMYLAAASQGTGDLGLKKPKPDEVGEDRSARVYPPLSQATPYLDRKKRTTWLSADGTRDGVLRVETLEPRELPGVPVPPEARERAGDVSMIPLPVCGPRVEQFRRDYMYLRTLSTDPVRMLEYLRSQSGDTDPDRRAFASAGDLIRESYLPPAQRAAVFRAIKLIPDVVVVPDAQDAAGRAGIAVARVNTATGLRDELIFDRETYRFLGERAYVVREGALGSIPVGTQVAGTAELSVAVADAPPSLSPDPGYGCS
jgi:hypothetical protein